MCKNTFERSLGLLGFLVMGAIAFAVGLTSGTGCRTTPSEETSTNAAVEVSSPAQARTSLVNCVVIGMEKSRRFGTCAGCALDADRMYSLLTKTYGYPTSLRKSEQATKETVTRLIKSGVEKTPPGGLFIFYYSGHGGQEVLSGWNTTEPEGADEADEYLCLEDTYLLDDEIWELMSPCKGRVFMIFDCCHSKTMFRSVRPEYAAQNGLAVTLATVPEVPSSPGFRLKPRAAVLGNAALSFCCWSGCQEVEYSYGSSLGGVMTTGLITSWDAADTYASLWTKICAHVKKNQPNQHPACTIVGSGWDTQVFK